MTAVFSGEPRAPPAQIPINLPLGRSPAVGGAEAIAARGGDGASIAQMYILRACRGNPPVPYAAYGRKIGGCGRRKERDVRRVASVSFGKDSLAMLLLLLEKEKPLDEVIFYNSGMEFQAIYDIRDRIRPILEQQGIRFTEVKPGVPFLYNMLERPVNSKKNGFHLGYGWCGGPCRWGTKLKTNALDGIAAGIFLGGKRCSAV